MYDVLIAGAGFAGVALANMLAEKGRKVLLVDESAEEDLGCDWYGWIEKGAFQIAGVGGPEKGEATAPIREMAVHSPDMQSWKTIDVFPSLLVDRKPFFRRLLKQAGQNGVEVRFGVKVLYPLYDENKVFGVALEDGGKVENIMARITVDATGVASVIRTKLPVEWDIDTDALADADLIREQHATHDFQVRDATQPPVGALLFRYGDNGRYAWVTRDREERISFGVGARKEEGEQSPADMLAEEVQSWAGTTNQVIRSGEGIVPVRRPLDNFCWNGFLLVGDSASQAVPIHGHNTGTALLAARLAADAAHEALSGLPADLEGLWKYNVLFHRGRGAQLAVLDMLRHFTIPVTDSDLNFLFQKDMVTSEFFSRLWNLKPLAISPLRAVLSGIRGIMRPSLVRRLNRALELSDKILRHYHAYPQTYDPLSFQSWTARNRKLFEEL